MRTFAVVLTLSGVAYADAPVDKATAEALFMRAKEREKAGDAVAACPLYEGSYRADPQLGALLNLANCHEQVGKLATAWAEFREAVELAKRRADYRSDYAQRRADALAPRVSWIVIRAAPASGLVVRRDATDVTLVIGQELPIDPGTYAVTASAPAHAPWTASVTISTPGTHAVVDVPALAEEATREVPAVVAPPAPAPVAVDRVPPSRAPRPAPPPSPQDHPSRLPYVVGGAGVVVLATGLVFGGRAYSQWNDSRDPSRCDARNVCSAEGTQLIADARQSATLATYLVAGGGAVIATSVVWWAITRHRGDETSPRVVPEVGPGAVGLSVGGAF